MLQKYIQGTEIHTGTRCRVDITTGQLVLAEEDNSATRRDSVQPLMRPLLTCAILIAAAFVLSACASQPSATQTNNSIEVESLRLTAAGHYVDLRYRVLDAEKASKVIGPGVKPTLIDEATGTVMAVPMTAKLGSLRQTRGVQKPDHLYFILFVNGAGLHSGSLVTAEIGDMRFENLTIE